MANCELCGEPMSEAESVFKFHGYSGPCPKPPLPKTMTINTAEIEARLAKATPGPWRSHPENNDGVVFATKSTGANTARFMAVARNVSCDNLDLLTHAPTDIRDLLAALKAETARADGYAERLEITSHWISYDDGTTLTRVDVPREDWDKQHDGIDCRDETIKGQDSLIDKLRAQLTAANEKLAAYAKAEKDAADLYDWVMSVCENPPEPTPALRAVWEKYKALPAFNTGDGNGR